MVKKGLKGVRVRLDRQESRKLVVRKSATCAQFESKCTAVVGDTCSAIMHDDWQMSIFARSHGVRDTGVRVAQASGSGSVTLESSMGRLSEDL